MHEVILAYGGCSFRFKQHPARLARSPAGIRISNPLTPTQWREETQP